MAVAVLRTGGRKRNDERGNKTGKHVSLSQVHFLAFHILYADGLPLGPPSTLSGLQVTHSNPLVAIPVPFRVDWARGRIGRGGKGRGQKESGLISGSWVAARGSRAVNRFVLSLCCEGVKHHLQTPSRDRLDRTAWKWLEGSGGQRTQQDKRHSLDGAELVRPLLVFPSPPHIGVQPIQWHRLRRPASTRLRRPRRPTRLWLANQGMARRLGSAGPSAKTERRQSGRWELRSDEGGRRNGMGVYFGDLFVLGVSLCLCVGVGVGVGIKHTEAVGLDGDWPVPLTTLYPVHFHAPATFRGLLYAFRSLLSFSWFYTRETSFETELDRHRRRWPPSPNAAGSCFTPLYWDYRIKRMSIALHPDSTLMKLCAARSSSTLPQQDHLALTVLNPSVSTPSKYATPHLSSNK
ncbi:hypothetical protein LIA77_02559 [Sarocladium implicatum]|nr:hypothetical protein LIA77_02559 [Sarocladium implicatum]